MGREELGKTPGLGGKRCAPGCACGRHRGNAGSFDKSRKNLEAGAGTRYKRKHPLPGVGDRFGELTVIGVGEKPHLVPVQCSCGAPPHLVYDYNLRKGASTRCNACAKKSANHWRKNFWGYADVCRDDAHRRRLLNRISAAFTRCHCKTSRQYHAYGGRGIEVFEPWRTDRKAFLSHLLTLHGWDTPEFDMDRIDVNLGYLPGNIRFVPLGENRGGNKRTVREMQTRILKLEARIRYLEQRPEQLLRSADEPGPTDSP